MNLYFGYGSNMWEDQMLRRCPESKKVGRATLHGYRWIISARGYASVVEATGDAVEGVLYTLSPSDEEALDLCEGVAIGSYRKANLPVWHDGVESFALVYIDLVTEEGQPKPEYIGRINSGLADAKLSNAYVAQVIRRLVPDQ